MVIRVQTSALALWLEISQTPPAYVGAWSMAKAIQHEQNLFVLTVFLDIIHAQR